MIIEVVFLGRLLENNSLQCFFSQLHTADKKCYHAYMVLDYSGVWRDRKEIQKNFAFPVCHSSEPFNPFLVSLLCFCSFAVTWCWAMISCPQPFSNCYLITTFFLLKPSFPVSHEKSLITFLKFICYCQPIYKMQRNLGIVENQLIPC